MPACFGIGLISSLDFLRIRQVTQPASKKIEETTKWTGDRLQAACALRGMCFASASYHPWNSCFFFSFFSRCNSRILLFLVLHKKGIAESINYFQNVSSVLSAVLKLNFNPNAKGIIIPRKLYSACCKMRHPQHCPSPNSSIQSPTQQLTWRPESALPPPPSAAQSARGIALSAMFPACLPRRRRLPMPPCNHQPRLTEMSTNATHSHSTSILAVPVPAD